jgi:hypothetical protein
MSGGERASGFNAILGSRDLGIDENVREREREG